MGKPTTLNFTKPMRTRGGSRIVIYEVFESDYINGAYYDEDSDVWYPVQWDWYGKYSNTQSALDLINKVIPNGNKAA